MTRSSMKSGFSLVEIMVAVLILGLVMAVVVPGYNKYKEKGRKTSTIATLKLLKNAVDEYADDLQGNYPESLTDLIKKPSNLEPEIADKWAEPYLTSKKIPLDGWNRPIQYKRTQGQEREYELYSNGPTSGKEKGKIDAWDL